MTDLRELSKRPVWVEWVDSKQAHGWWKPEETKPDKLECITLGFLVGEDEETVQVADSISALGNFGCVMTIPKVAITKIQEVCWT